MDSAILMLTSIAMMSECFRMVGRYWGFDITRYTCASTVTLLIVISSAPVSTLDIELMAEKRFVFALAGYSIICAIHLIYGERH